MTKTPASAPAFDLRKLEMLSNTIFGVAMTLLAYDLPKLTARADPHSLGSIEAALAERVIVIGVSFAVAGLFWLSHYRRLALNPEGSNAIVALNLLFLFLIVLLPSSTGLYGADIGSPIALRLYAAHLALLSLTNMILWICAAGRARLYLAVGPLYGFTVFLIAELLSFISVKTANFAIFAAFFTPLVASAARRAATRQTAARKIAADAQSDLDASI